MDESSRLSLMIVIILLLCADYFAVCETAFSAVSRVRIKVRAERGEAKAVRALGILEHFDRAISSILICTNIVHISAASIVTVTVTRLWGMSYVTLSTVVMTLVIFFLGEMLPKSIAKKYSERLSLSLAGSLSLIMKLVSPLAALLSAITRFAGRFVKSDPEKSVTEDELLDIIEDMTEEGSLDSERGELISSALQFGDTTVESIVTARVDLAAIDAEDPQEEILAFIREQKHSRLPVYEGSIDNIIGILSIRKYIKAYIRSGAQTDLRSLLDEPYFVHQSTMIADLLPVMSKKRINLAVITDNYGGTLGIVTVEDILEELVGEIWDEDDVVREPWSRAADGSLDCDAGMALSDVFGLLGTDCPDDGDYTNKLLGEWAYEHFSAIPEVGASFEWNGVSVRVTGMRQNRILRLSVGLIPEGGSAE